MPTYEYMLYSISAEQLRTGEGVKAREAALSRYGAEGWRVSHAAPLMMQYSNGYIILILERATTPTQHTFTIERARVALRKVIPVPAGSRSG